MMHIALAPFFPTIVAMTKIWIREDHTFYRQCFSENENMTIDFKTFTLNWYSLIHFSINFFNAILSNYYNKMILLSYNTPWYYYPGSNSVVPLPWAPVRSQDIRLRRRHMGGGLHIWGDAQQLPAISWGNRHWAVVLCVESVGNSNQRGICKHTNIQPDKPETYKHTNQRELK